MGGVNRGGNWKRNAGIVGGSAIGLGALGYGLSKAYQAYDKANFIKEAATNMSSPLSSPILQMIPIF